jgi:molybdate transport system permease protein
MASSLRAAEPGAGSTRAGLRLAGGLAGALLVVLLGFPFLALLFRVSPARLIARLGDPAALQALWLSLVTSTFATVIIVATGLPVAYLLATRRFPGKRLLEVLIDLPMVLPPTVAGLALLLAFGRAGLAGRALALFGVAIPFTTVAVVLAQTFMAAPFFVSAARAGFGSVEARYRDAAATLRASEPVTFLRVVIPLSAPALVAGAGMSWARALGEFGATITFAGNLPGRTQTMPLAVYVALQEDLELAVTLSLILVALAAGLLLTLRTATGFPLIAAHARDRRD